MPDQLQLRGGTTTEHNSFTGAAREVTVDTTKKTVVVHDGSQAGGTPLMKESGATAASSVTLGTGGVERLKLTSSEVVVNETGTNTDFRIESDTKTHMFFVDAGNNRIGINTGSPSSVFSIQDTATAGDGITEALRLVSSSNTNNDGTRLAFARSGVGVTASIDAVKNETAANETDIRFSNMTAGSLTEKARFDGQGKFLIGSTSARTNFFNAASTHRPRLQVESTNSDIGRAALGLIYGKSNASGAYIVLAKHRSNSIGGNTVVQSGDETGIISFQGSDGSQFVDAARIESFVDGTPGSDDMPGRLVFSTTADGASSPTERMRIDSSGNVGIGTASPRQKLDVTGNIFASNSSQIQITGTASSKGLQLIGQDDGTSLIGTMGSSGEHLLFRTASSERMRLLVGGSHLLLGGTASVNEITESAANAGIVIGGTGFGNAGLAIITSTSGTGRLYFGDDVGGNTGRNVGQINYGHSDNHMRFVTNSTERIRIDSSGNVGIGTTSTGSYPVGVTPRKVQMEIKGAINTSSNAHQGQLALNCTNSSSALHLVRSDNTQTSGTGIGQVMFTYSDGTDFHAAASILAIKGAAGGNNDTPGALLFSTTADGATTVSERMRIHSNGAISVGTNDSARSFTLFNVVSSDVILRIQNDTANEDTGLEIYYNGSSATRNFRMGGRVVADNDAMQFVASEEMRFYTDNATTHALVIQENKRIVAPQVFSTAGSSMRDVQCESDGTLACLTSITKSKINIADVTDVSWLYNLKPKTFNFRKKTVDAKTGINTYLDEAEDEKAYGLLAEDVETVNKDFCFYDKDSEDNDVLAGVYYKTMVVPLIKAVQDLKSENTALATRITALEAA